MLSPENKTKKKEGSKKKNQYKKGSLSAPVPQVSTLTTSRAAYIIVFSGSAEVVASVRFSHVLKVPSQARET